MLLDPATGETTGEIATPPAVLKDIEGDTPAWQETRIRGEALVVSIGNRLVCMDRHTGELRWQRTADRDRFGFALGARRVFAADYWLPERRRRGEGKDGACSIEAVDLATGETLWESTARLPRELKNAPSSGWLQNAVSPLEPYLSYSSSRDALLLSAGYSIVAGYDAEDGKRLWQSDNGIPISRARPPVVLPDRFVTRSGWAYDLLSGRKTGERLWSGLRACNRAISSRDTIFVRDGLPMVCEPLSGRRTYFMSVRSGCTNSLIPADGVLAAPNIAVGCACNYPVVTSFGAAHMPQAGDWRRAAAPE
jgi:hypothetical protein